ncbi:hypothetical protein [Amycolatopsis sp. YIM 10]|uniref:hypothetical protein n=1 Tax=Amycolatopsis sp. YIM 10 TaxID=2653857 RepID=UPI0012901E77|nr:hypothetical protein [Amycolatopsis sp. YIM 10]QFU87865.1 hypothetical protein YIM_13395 [Amycolatopsis sp. YIM 10]QFU94822.1 hypothetical protein YIM_48485 [Amycolatopsis sp. YIM 10]
MIEILIEDDHAAQWARGVAAGWESVYQNATSSPGSETSPAYWRGFAAGRRVTRRVHNERSVAGKEWYELTRAERWDIILEHGQNPALPPRGVSRGEPPPGLRNWVCAADGHADPDNSGLCIHCGTVLDDDEDGEEWWS